MTSTLGSAVQARTVDKHQVRFVCQRCQLPLKIDLSFETIDTQSEIVKELTGTILFV